MLSIGIIWRDEEAEQRGARNVGSQWELFLNELDEAVGTPMGVTDDQ